MLHNLCGADDVSQTHRLMQPIVFEGWVNDAEWGSVISTWRSSYMMTMPPI